MMQASKKEYINNQEYIESLELYVKITSEIEEQLKNQNNYLN